MSITKHNAPDDIFEPISPQPRHLEAGANQTNQTMKSKRIALDIETIGFSREVLLPRAPEFSAPANYKDPGKIAEYIASAQQRWLDDAALSSLTGRVAIIGTLDLDTDEWCGQVIRHDDDEKAALELFWKDNFYTRQNTICGWNLFGFDLPFLIQRSFVHRVRVPMASLFRGTYFNRDTVTDLQELWAVFSRTRTGMSLAEVAKVCGAGEKTAEGSDFKRLWETDQDAAVEYCKQDCRLVKQLTYHMFA